MAILTWNLSTMPIVRRALFALLCTLPPLMQSCVADEVVLSSSEKELKVAFLYNFALYTEWPTPLADGITLCVFGRDNLGSALDALAGRQINGKPMAVRRLDGRADISGCHMIYIAATDAKLPSLRQKAVLSVKEAGNPDFAIISLGREGNRLVFDVDNTNARAAGLALSSKLLRLARSVF